MGRIVTPLGAGQSFFGRTSRVKLGTGPITTINPIKAIGQGALATAAGVKAIEGVADLTIKGVGAIAKGVAEGKRAAARKALAQDTATQQGQVDTAVSEAGQALESMPGLQEPSIGMEQFLQQQGLTSPPGLSAPAGTLFPGELQLDELLERQQQLRTRPGTANVLAAQGAPAPEQAAVDRQLTMMEKLYGVEGARIAQAAAERDDREQYRDSRLASAMALEGAANRLAPELAPSVSPELTQPLRQPFQPTVDLSRLEDLGPLSDRALATYDPGQLMAAAASTRDPAVMRRLLRAAQGQAQPTNFAELVSGKRQADLDKAIIDQFGKFVPEPEKPLSALDLQRIQESQQRISASKTKQELDDLRRQKLQDAIDRANRPRGRKKPKKSTQEFGLWSQNGADFVGNRGAYSDDAILAQSGEMISKDGRSSRLIRSKAELEQYIASLPEQDRGRVRSQVQAEINRARQEKYNETLKRFPTFKEFRFTTTGIAAAQAKASDADRSKEGNRNIKNIARSASDYVKTTDRPGQIEAESFSRETGRLGAQKPIRDAQAAAEAAKAAAEAAEKERESANSLAELRTLARAINSQVAQADRNLKQVQEEIRVAVGTPIATSKKAKENEFASSNAKKITLRQLRKDERALAASLAKLKKEQKMATEKANQAAKANAQTPE